MFAASSIQVSNSKSELCKVSCRGPGLAKDGEAGRLSRDQTINHHSRKWLCDMGFMRSRGKFEDPVRRLTICSCALAVCKDTPGLHAEWVGFRKRRAGQDVHVLAAVLIAHRA